LAQAISSQTFSRINTPFHKPSHPSYLSAYEDETEFPKRRNIKFRRRGITQKKAYNKECRYFSSFIPVRLLRWNRVFRNVGI